MVDVLMAGDGRGGKEVAMMLLMVDEVFRGN